MIQRITIRDYQSLGNVTIRPGAFTVMVGPSNLGKSAVIRAIQACIENQTGSGFIRRGTKATQVEVEFDDALVAWVKATGGATYVMSGINAQNGVHGSPAVFEKFGASVPEEVREVIRLGPVKIGNDEFSPNVHSQFPGTPFLVAETPGVRARWIGELSGVNRLYLAIQQGRNTSQQLQRELTIRQKDIEAVQTQVREFEDLPGQIDRLQVAALAVTELHQAQERAKRAASLLSRIQATAVQGLAFQETVKRLAPLLSDDVTRMVASISDMAAQLKACRAILSRYAELDERRRQITVLMTVLNREIGELDGQLASVAVCPTCGRPL